jgi:ribulose bisphosphate carboxylase small subunit
VGDTGHHVINGHHVVCVEHVDDARFGLTVWAGARNTAQHEETEVVGVNGSGTINHLTSLVVVVERLPHVVDIVTE